jgi:hypothetical protein
MFADLKFNKGACCHNPVIMEAGLCKNENQSSVSRMHERICRAELTDTAEQANMTA